MESKLMGLNRTKLEKLETVCIEVRRINRCVLDGWVKNKDGVRLWY